MTSLQIEPILKGRNSQPHQLIEVLQDVQESYGYIPEEAMREISKALGVHLIEVYRVASFYKAFKLKPSGKYVLTICNGTACHVSDAEMIIETIEDELSIEVGGTTEDGLFTLTIVACIGCCSLSPVIMINDKTHGRLTPASVRKLLRSYRHKETIARAEKLSASCDERA